MRPGRSTEVVSFLLAELDPDFRQGLEVVTLDGFSGYAPAVYRVVAKAVKVMDPFHVVHLAAEKLTRCWQRVQHECTGRRGKTNGPLY